MNGSNVRELLSFLFGNTLDTDLQSRQANFLWHPLTLLLITTGLVLAVAMSLR